MTVVLPGDITALILDVLERRFGEHQRAYEHDRGLRPFTLEKVLFDRILYPGQRKVSEHPAPCALVWGARPIEKLIEGTTVTIEYQWLVELWVEGQDSADTIERRDILLLLLQECLEGRMPRRGPIDRCEVVDFEVGERDDELGGTEALAILDLTISVPSSYRIDRFPPDDSPMQPGTPGGPVDPDGEAPPVPPATVESIEDVVEFKD